LKKLYFLTLLLIFTPFLVHAEAAPDYFFTNYEIMDLDFLRTHYYEINNGRQIQFEGYFKSKTWLEPFDYKERLRLIGFNVDNYNLIQLALKEKDEYHYTFPVLMFHSITGDLKELDQLTEGDRVVIYGRFYNLKKADFGIEVDIIETIKKGGHETDMVLDGRVSPTPTATATITPTPGLSVWQKVNNLVNPKPTMTPTGTITPEINND
jgi:hypothetical protein